MIRIITFIILINLYVDAFAQGSDVSCKQTDVGKYLSGFVVDKSNNGVVNADVYMFHESTPVAEAITGENGWFVTDSGVSDMCIGSEVAITIFARGYETFRKIVPIEEIIGYKFEMTLLPKGVPLYSEKTNTDRLYGYISTDNNENLNVSVISLRECKDKKCKNVSDKAISKAVTDKHGYFGIDFDSEYRGKKLAVEVSSDQYDTEILKKVELASKKFVTKELHQDKDNLFVSIGFNYVFITDYDSARINKPSADVRSEHMEVNLNIVCFPDAIVFKDRSISKFEKNRLGYELSLGYSQLLVVDSASGRGVRTRDVSSLGVGLVWLLNDTDFMLRFGALQSDKGETGVYVGLSVPVVSFMKIFQ